jgi:hypothetical protein
MAAGPCAWCVSIWSMFFHAASAAALLLGGEMVASLGEGVSEVVQALSNSINSALRTFCGDIGALGEAPPMVEGV